MMEPAIVEHPGADADEALIFNHAAMHRRVVADGDPVPDDDRVEIALAVEDRAVLHVGAGPDADRIHVAAQDGIHPN
jgi:hypothetical protein